MQSHRPAQDVLDSMDSQTYDASTEPEPGIPEGWEVVPGCDWSEPRPGLLDNRGAWRQRILRRTTS